MLDPALPTLDKAFVGMSGQAAIEALDGFTLVTSGSTGIGYEGYTPETFQTGVTTFDETVDADLVGDAWRVDTARDNWFFGVPIPQTFSVVLNGDVGEVDGTESILGFPSVMTSDRWASIRRTQRLLNPQLLLKDVAADPTLASEAGVQLLDGSVHELLVVQDDVAPITLWIDANTGRLDELSTWESDNTFSDVPVQVFYSGWTASTGDVLFPSQVYVAVDGQIVRSETRSGAAQVNPTFPTGTFDLTTTPPAYDAALATYGEETNENHQEFAGIGIPLDGMQTALYEVEIAPGVWHEEGGSHHSLLVEQENGLVLFDAPLYPELGEQLVDFAAAQYPTKPITKVVVSHFHRDHIGGLRALVAAGATLVVHEKDEAFFRDLFDRPRTIRPDALAASPVTPTFELVPDGGSVLLDDALRPIEVLSIANYHAQDLVIPYLPNEQIAFSVDIYSPGFGVNAFGPNLYDGLTTQHPRAVSLVAGGHGFGTQTWGGFVDELVGAGLLVP